MSTGTGNAEGIFGTFPYETVITPATVAGLVVATAQFLLDLALNSTIELTTETIVLELIESIGTIGLLVAVLAIVVSGARNDVLIVGAILAYVASLLAELLASVYLPGSLELTTELFLAPLSPVILAVGIGIGVNWIGVDVSL